MNFLGRDINARDLLAEVENRLRSRGLLTRGWTEAANSPPEGSVDPLTFNLNALETHVDPSEFLATGKGWPGAIVSAGVRFIARPLLARQTIFNTHVRDSYAQLSAEVLRLRNEVTRLQAIDHQGASVTKRHRKAKKPLRKR